MILGCLASLPDDLPQMEGPNGAGEGSRSVSVVGNVSGPSGMAPRLKTEPMDIEESGASCMVTGQQDKNVHVSQRDKTFDKEAAMCCIIDEIA